MVSYGLGDLLQDHRSKSPAVALAGDGAPGISPLVGRRKASDIRDKNKLRYQAVLRNPKIHVM